MSRPGLTRLDTVSAINKRSVGEIGDLRSFFESQSDEDLSPSRSRSKSPSRSRLSPSRRNKSPSRSRLSPGRRRWDKDPIAQVSPVFEDESKIDGPTVIIIEPPKEESPKEPPEEEPPKEEPLMPKAEPPEEESPEEQQPPEEEQPLEEEHSKEQQPVQEEEPEGKEPLVGQTEKRDEGSQETETSSSSSEEEEFVEKEHHKDSTDSVPTLQPSSVPTLQPSSVPELAPLGPRESDTDSDSDSYRNEEKAMAADSDQESSEYEQRTTVNENKVSSVSSSSRHKTAGGDPDKKFFEIEENLIENGEKVRRRSIEWCNCTLASGILWWGFFQGSLGIVTLMWSIALETVDPFIGACDAIIALVQVITTLYILFGSIYDGDVDALIVYYRITIVLVFAATVSFAIAMNFILNISAEDFAEATEGYIINEYSFFLYVRIAIYVIGIIMLIIGIIMLSVYIKRLEREFEENPVDIDETELEEFPLELPETIYSLVLTFSPSYDFLDRNELLFMGEAILMLLFSHIIQLSFIYSVSDMSNEAKRVRDLEELACARGNSFGLLVVAVFGFVAAVSIDVWESVNMALWLYYCPQKKPGKMKKRKRLVSYVRGTPGRCCSLWVGIKWILFVLVLVPKFLVAALLLFYGIGYVVSIEGPEELILNAVAMVFVLDFDEMFLSFFSSGRIAALEERQTYQWRRSDSVLYASETMKRLWDSSIPRLLLALVVWLPMHLYWC